MTPAELLLSICKNVLVKRHVDKKPDYVFMPQGHGFDSGPARSIGNIGSCLGCKITGGAA